MKERKGIISGVVRGNTERLLLRPGVEKESPEMRHHQASMRNVFKKI